MSDAEDRVSSGRSWAEFCDALKRAGEQIQRTKLARRQFRGQPWMQGGEELAAPQNGSELVPALRELVGQRLQVTARDYLQYTKTA